MTQTANTTLPDGIEIFRAGTHVSDSGDSYTFSDQDIAHIAASYNPALREAPLTVGHPESDRPAYGWVRAVSAAGDTLKIDTHQVEPQFAEMVESSRFKKRSACFYPPNSPHNPTPGRWYLRHVAFLGAQPPAVAGLKDIQFQADAADGVRFSDGGAVPITTLPENDTMDKELQEQLDQAKADLAKAQADLASANQGKSVAEQEAATAKAAAAKFAEKSRSDRRAGFVAFADSQVTAGKLLPKDKDMAVAAMDALADVEPVQFSEGDTTRKVAHVQWLQELISNAPSQVNFGEFAPGRVAPAAGAAKGKSDAEIDAAARQYASQHKVAYSDALNHVTAPSFSV